MVTVTEREPDRPRRIAWTAASLLLMIGAASQAGRSGAPAIAPACTVSVATPLSALVSCLTVRPNDVALMIAIGDRLETEGRMREAAAMYYRARATDVLDADAQVRFARAMLRDDPEAAREAAASALALRPNSATVLDLLARAGALAGGDR